jgi:hypothetical protein
MRAPPVLSGEARATQIPGHTGAGATPLMTLSIVGASFVGILIAGTLLGCGRYGKPVRSTALRAEAVHSVTAHNTTQIASNVVMLNAGVAKNGAPESSSAIPPKKR